MNDEQLGRKVSGVLHELYPEPTHVDLMVPELPTRRLRRGVLMTLAAACVLGVVAGALVIGRGGSSGSSAGGTAAGSAPSTVQPSEGSTITVNPDTQSTFVALPMSDAPQGSLSANDAWSKREAALGVASSPDDFTIQYGLLTIPMDRSGPTASWTYSAKDEPSYAFSISGACLQTGGPPVRSSSEAATSPPSEAQPPQCRQWIFLDAFTGKQITEIWQPEN